MQRVEIVAIEAILKLRDFEIVKTLELNISIGERLAKLWLVLRQKVDCSLIALGVYDELRVVCTSHLGCVGIHESWRRTTYETGDACDAFII